MTAEEKTEDLERAISLIIRAILEQQKYGQISPEVISSLKLKI